MILFIIMIIVLFSFIKPSLTPNQKGGSSEEADVLRTHIIDNCLDKWKKGRSCPAPKCMINNNYEGEYDVYYQGKKRNGTTLKITADGNATQSTGSSVHFNQKIVTENVREKCTDTRDADAEFYIENTHGANKYECLRKDGDNLVGGHYINNGSYWGDVRYNRRSPEESEKVTSTMSSITQLKREEVLPPVKIAIPNIQNVRSTGSMILHSTPDITKSNLKYIKLTGKWKDQAWGNRKGQLYITLTNTGNDDKYSIRVCNTNKDYTATHSWSNINFTIFSDKSFTYNDTVSRAVHKSIPNFTSGREWCFYPNFKVQLEYVVGGGGGHKLYAENLKLEIQQFKHDESVTPAEKEFKIVSKSTPSNDWGGGNSIYLDRHKVDCGKDGINSFRLRRPAGNRLSYNYDCLSGINLPSTDTNTGANNWGGGNTIYLDRHNVDCNGKPIAHFKLTRPKRDELSYRYGCIDYTGKQQCRDLNTGWNRESSSSIYLDRHHVKCNTDEFLSQFRLARDGNGNFRYNYKCCK